MVASQSSCSGAAGLRASQSTRQKVFGRASTCLSSGFQSIRSGPPLVFRHNHDSVITSHPEKSTYQLTGSALRKQRRAAEERVQPAGTTSPLPSRAARV